MCDVSLFLAHIKAVLISSFESELNFMKINLNLHKVWCAQTFIVTYSADFRSHNKMIYFANFKLTFFFLVQVLIENCVFVRMCFYLCPDAAYMQVYTVMHN